MSKQLSFKQRTNRLGNQSNGSITTFSYVGKTTYVVYFDQLWGAAHTQKLVETLF